MANLIFFSGENSPNSLFVCPACTLRNFLGFLEYCWDSRPNVFASSFSGSVFSCSNNQPYRNCPKVVSLHANRSRFVFPLVPDAGLPSLGLHLPCLARSGSGRDISPIRDPQKHSAVHSRRCSSSVRYKVIPTAKKIYLGHINSTLWVT